MAIPHNQNSLTFRECKLGMKVLVAGEVEGIIDELDSESQLVHTKPVQGGEKYIASGVGLATVAGWRSPWQLDRCAS